MPDADDERLAGICEQVWLQVRDLEPTEILTVLLAVTSELIAVNDEAETCLDYACEILGEFVHHVKAQRPHLRLVPKEPA